MLDWLIIGGGIHGTHLAHVLINQCGVSAAAVRILDPHARLLQAWSKRAENTGMRYLRSTRVHHIDINSRSLERFGQEKQPYDSNLWIDPYYRPSLEIFKEHCQHVIDTYQLQDLHTHGQALALHRVRNGWRVDTDSAKLKTRKVLLATGRQKPFIPDWADPLIKQNAPIQHVLDMTFDMQHVSNEAQVMVIGGGISAGQIALKLMSGHSVTLVTRHPLRQLDFDSSPCWLGPACMDSFEEAQYPRRRWMLGEARHPGTLAQDVYKDIHTAIEAGEMLLHQGEVVNANMTNDNRVSLTMVDGSIVTVDYVVLATGLQAVQPKHTWLADTIKRYNLPLADCGYPILDEKLRWAKGLYATGSLAELELGPAAANIAGARAAGRRWYERE